jgi:formylglycine-generating enzyme required for sulfatase activity
MLQPFVHALSSDDRFRVSVRDWHRLRVVLSTPGAAANLGQLRAILRSVLVCSEHEGRTFDRRFHEFFATAPAEPLDIKAALEELDNLIAMPSNNRDVALDTNPSQSAQTPIKGHAYRAATPTVPRNITLDTGPSRKRETPSEIQANRVATPSNTPDVAPGPSHNTQAPTDDLGPAEVPIPVTEERPTVELIDEQPMQFDLDEEQLGPWLDNIPLAKFDRHGPTYFSMGLVCRQRKAMLGDAQLQEAADSLGFFRSDTFSTRLDIPHSIAATIQHGGLPSPRFENRRQLLSVAVLIDQSARDLRWNTIPHELADGLRRRGVSVVSYTFHGIPHRLIDAQGRAVDIEDLEELRRKLIVLLVTDGHGMYSQAERRPLERMSRWPRVALLDTRPDGLHDLVPQLARQYRLPLYPCDESGLIDCLRHFTSESGSLGQTARLAAARRSPAVVRGRHPNDESFLKAFLSQDELNFAQACVLTPAISLGLADCLRSKFFPSLPPSAIGRLLALPGTRLTWAGIGFDAPTRDALLCGFQQQDVGWQSDVARFVTTHIQHTADQLGRGKHAGLAALQGRCLIGMIRALIPDESVDLHDLIGIWKLPELSASTDTAIEAVLDRIQSKPLQRVAQTRLRVAQRTSDKPRRDPVPDNLARILAGQFWMGDPSQQGDDDERPRRQVDVSEFFLEKQPVTWSLWQRVYAWAVDHGYEFDESGAGKGEHHPVQTVNWYDAMKWCNARSEMEGLKPCYYQDADHQRLDRAGQTDLQDACVDWTADGYRLPIEAEWEKAARGGLDGHHYPWESPADQNHRELISDDRANFCRKLRHTSAVGDYAANDYGLCDMSGNVREWCWDVAGLAWYGQPEAATTDTHGPDTPGGQRVVRGGGWADDAGLLRCSYRNWIHPRFRDNRLGFRVARGRVGPARSERVAEAEARDGAPAEAMSEQNSPRSARVIFVASVPDQTAQITLAAARNPSLTCTITLGTTEPLQPGQWHVSLATPGFQPAVALIEARAFYQRTYRVSLQPLISENLARIPAGRFWMGDPSQQGYGSEQPRHPVDVSEFFLEKQPVTWALWQPVHGWALQRGYKFDSPGAGNGENHPVHTVTWYDAVKWCNARSEMEGLTPCYYKDVRCQRLYRSGKPVLKDVYVDWTADGYRLPTEAEWEKAARGGYEGQHYPWESPADQHYEEPISPDRANYDRELGGTSPVDKYPANGYGLYDMSGNVWEWCWDVWDEKWYSKPEAATADTHGPDASGEPRVVRGGGWARDARDLRCSFRDWFLPGHRSGHLGFRVARGRVGPAGSERVDEAEARDEPPAEATLMKNSEN